MIDKERENLINSELKQNKSVNTEMIEKEQEDTLTIEENQVIEDAINEVIEEDIKSELIENISESSDEVEEVKEDSNNMNYPSHTPSDVITKAEIREYTEQSSEGDLETQNSEGSLETGNSEVKEWNSEQNEEEEVIKEIELEDDEVVDGSSTILSPGLKEEETDDEAAVEEEEQQQQEEGADEEEVEEETEGKEEEQATGVQTEVDECGNVVSVFSTAVSRSAQVAAYTLQDTRLPAGVTKPAGSVSHFGDTEGGVAFSIVDSKKDKTVQEGKYEFQGTAKASLVFTGGILDAQATVSQVKEVKDGSIEFDSTSTVKGSLREFLIKAANEKIDDINGFSKELTSAAIDDRTHLVLALSAVLGANDGKAESDAPLRLTFKDLDSLVPKQTTLEFAASTLFTTSIDFVKNIVNEDSFVNNLNGKTNNVKSQSNVNLNAEGIAVNIDFKAKDAKNGLKTNTRYEFVAPNKDIVFYPNCTETSGSCISYVEGLTMTQFKTGKRLPLFEAYCVSGASGSEKLEPISTIATSSLFSATKEGASTCLVTSIDFNTVDKETFIDYDNMISMAASNIAMKVGGTSIKFNTLKIFDQDETITKIEVEDDRLNRYPVTLVPISESNKDCGAYPQVTGLQRSTPYMFRKLYITAQPEDESITKTIELVTLSCADKGGSSGTVTAISHNLSVRTANFTEPKLSIGLDPSKKYVKPSDGNFDTDSTGNTQVFIPKMDVELPNKIKMPAVKNDKDSLRYVIEVENTDAEIKDLTVNGLKGDEQYKVEKVEGEDKTFFILTLFNLSENRDYGFLILELSYVDLDGRELITRQVLSNINIITQVNVTGGTHTGLIQYPDATLDNTTGPELMGSDIFNVTLFEAKTLEARKAEIPVFIDDINGRFVRMEFKSPEGNPNVKLELDGSLLRFTNLEPKTEVVYKIDFIWRDKGGKEQTLSKYAKISTPQVPAVDVKGTTIKTTDKTANIAFSLYADPKSPINSISLSDEKLKFTWDTPSLTLKLTDLKADTIYKDLEIIFKLENGLITRYKIDQFTTQKEVQPPTGKVAEFVSRIYVASLGRQPEIDGWKFWVQKLESKELPVTQFIYDLMKQDEFVERYLSKEDFIKMMYQIVVDRDPEEDGQKYWESKYDEYKLQEASIADVRIRIASEMMNEQEFKNYVSSMGLKY